MITTVQPLPAGNAIRLFITPPAGAVKWRVLRKGDDSFGLPDDESAVTVYEGDDKVVLDTAYLINEQVAFYRPFYRMLNGTWQPGSTAIGTPRAIYEDHSTDALSVVRDRLEAGLLVEVQRENFATEIGYIQVYSAPPSLDQNLRFPLVTVHLDDESSSERAIGETMFNDEFDAIGGDWFEEEGWLAQVSLSIIGWSLNSDERIELRKAMRRIIVANMKVFDDAGMTGINFSQQDVDAVSGEFGAPMYQVMGTFSCLAPVRVGNKRDAITDIEVRSTNG